MKSSNAPQPHPRPRLWHDAQLIGDVLVLAPLRRLKAEREVAVVLGAAEVRELPHAEPEHPVCQRVGEVDVLPVGHRCPRSRRAPLKQPWAWAWVCIPLTLGRL